MARNYKQEYKTQAGLDSIFNEVDIMLKLTGGRDD